MQASRASRQSALALLLALAVLTWGLPQPSFAVYGRRAALGLVPLALVASEKSAGAEEVLQDIQEQAAKLAAATVSIGAVGEDLVFPRWFAGEWACAGELLKVASGPLGTIALAKALPGVSDALLVSNRAVGTDAADFRARRRWSETQRPAPGGSPGAVEDPSGLSAGAAAAATALAGPGAQIRQVSSEKPAWEVAGQWKLQAAGAVARPDPELPGALRVSELFEVAPAAKTGAPSSAVVRVVTTWRQAPLEGSEEIQKELRDLGEPDKSRKSILQAVQQVYVLTDQSAKNENNLASLITRFVYSPILSLPS